VYPRWYRDVPRCYPRWYRDVPRCYPRVGRRDGSVYTGKVRRGTAGGTPGGGRRVLYPAPGSRETARSCGGRRTTPPWVHQPPTSSLLIHLQGTLLSRNDALGSTLPVYPGWWNFSLPGSSFPVTFCQSDLLLLPISASCQKAKIGCAGGNHRFYSLGTSPDVHPMSDPDTHPMLQKVPRSHPRF